MSKSSRPSLKVDDGDLLPRIKPAGAEGMDDARILAAADELSARHGALRDSGNRGPSKSESKTAESPRAVMSLSLPDYLDLELSLTAAKRKVSKGFLILEALAKAGYQVKVEDMIGDRRRKRK